jgi:ech hydrogenase subunit D
MEPSAIIPISTAEVVQKAEQEKKDGCRLVLMSCTKIDDIFEVIYSYEKDLRLKNYRITVKQSDEIPSISGIYWGSFVYENEMNDLFGLNVTGINIDFKGHFFQTSVKHPFSVTITKEDDACQNR